MNKKPRLIEKIKNNNKTVSKSARYFKALCTQLHATNICHKNQPEYITEEFSMVSGEGPTFFPEEKKSSSYLFLFQNRWIISRENIFNSFLRAIKKEEEKKKR